LIDKLKNASLSEREKMIKIVCDSVDGSHVGESFAGTLTAFSSARKTCGVTRAFKIIREKSLVRKTPGEFPSMNFPRRSLAAENLSTIGKLFSFSVFLPKEKKKFLGLRKSKSQK
jgi:hypothetical protein